MANGHRAWRPCLVTTVGVCYGMRPRDRETARQHIRNTLVMLRLVMETGEVSYGNEGPGVIVPTETLGAIQVRLEAAIEQLEPPTRLLDFPYRPEE